MKNTKIKIKCVGGGGTNLLYLLCLISNTMPQLEQSSLQPSTYLQHRHLLQTTSYSHLLRLHLLISRKRNHKQQQARTPPPPPPPPRRGVEKPEGPSALQPTTENRLGFFTEEGTKHPPRGRKMTLHTRCPLNVLGILRGLCAFFCQTNL